MSPLPTSHLIGVPVLCASLVTLRSSPILAHSAKFSAGAHDRFYSYIITNNIS